MLPYCEEREVVSFDATVTMSSVANAPSGNIDRLSERAMTFCARHLGHIVLDGCLVDQQGCAFASVNERIARHRVAREAIGQDRSAKTPIASHLNLDVRNSPATLVCDDCPPRSTPMQDGDGGHFDETGNRQEVGQRFRALVTTPSVCNKIARSADPRLTLYCRGKVSCPARRGSCRGNEPPDRARCDPSPDRGQRADAAQ